MENKIFIILSLLGISSYAQVKMGNNPTIVNTNSLLELESTNKGLLIPRLALSATNNVAPLSAHVQGMVIYNTASDGTAPYEVTPGYYFNNGSIWQRIATASELANIYTTNGTLTDNRTVAQSDKTLNFTSTATTGTSHFRVDGSTFNIDAANNRVGISTTAPVIGLDTRTGFHFEDNGDGAANAQGGYLTWNNAKLGGSTQGYVGFLNHQGLGSGGFLFSTTTDNATFSEKMRITGTGFVGIGTATPVEKLDVRNGGVSINGSLNVNKTSSLGLDWDFTNNNARIRSWGPNASTSGGITFWTAVAGGGSVQRVGITGNGLVGIGTDNPGNRLEVNSGTAGLSGLRFTNMNNSSATSTSGVATLGVNTNGDVVVASSSTIDILARGRFDFGDVGVATAPAPALTGAVNISSVSKLDGNTMRVYFTNAVPTSAFVMVQLRVNAQGTSSSYILNQTTTYVDVAITEWCCGQSVQLDLMVFR